MEKRIGKKKNRKRNENRIEKREIKVQIEKEQKSLNQKGSKSLNRNWKM